MTGSEFRDAMKTLGLSQKWLAERLGVQRETPSRWAGGTRAVPKYVVAFLETLAELRRAQNALEVAVAMLPEFKQRETST